jgi:hypothetical protein
MNLYDNSKSLIISINLCKIKNMIHLSNSKLDESLAAYLHVETYGIQVSKT